MFSRKHEVELLLIACEEGDVVVTLDVFETHNFSTGDITSVGVDRKLQLTVFQCELLVFAVQSFVEKCSGVTLCSGDSLLLLGFKLVLLCDFSLFAQCVLDRVLLALCSDFLLGWLHIPRIAE